MNILRVGDFMESWSIAQLLYYANDMYWYAKDRCKTKTYYLVINNCYIFLEELQHNQAFLQALSSQAQTIVYDMINSACRIVYLAKSKEKNKDELIFNQLETFKENTFKIAKLFA